MLSAVAFLTVLPGRQQPDGRTLRWFPAVGVVLGGVLAMVWLAGSAVWSPAIVAVIVVAADLVLTGMLHIDGLADSADGLLPHLDRERRLAVMRTPDVGAFALAVVPTVLLARWAALAGDRIEIESLVAIWAASRTLMSVVPAVVPYARELGLASPFLDGARRWFAVWLLPAGALLVFSHELTGALALLAGLGAAAGVVTIAHHRIGGFTGDVLGAMAVVFETVTLVVLTGR